MIQNIITLLDEHPLEWEFDRRPSYDKDQLLHHKKSKISLRLYFSYSQDREPCRVRIWHPGSDLGWWEHRKLLAAVKRLQRRRYDAQAAKYLETHRPPCYYCKTKLKCPKCDK